MHALTPRPYSHPGDLDRLLDLLHAVRSAESIAGFPGPVDLQEILALSGIPERTRIWVDAAGAWAAFAVVDAWDNLWFEALPGYGSEALEDDMVAWGEACVRAGAAAGEGRSVLALDTSCEREQVDRLAMLARHGFVEQSMHTLQLERDLRQPIPAAVLPPGFTIRAVRGEAEVEALVALHRAAFQTEIMTVAYRLAMMRVREYDPRLDMIAVAPDGSLAAFCVGGIDASGIAGSTDPVGVHPAYRRQGLARVLLLETLSRLRQRGVETAHLTTTSENAAMLKTAAAAGFTLQSTKLWFSKLLA